MKKLSAIIILLFVNLVWGVTFPVVKETIQDMDVYVFIFLRFSLGIITLIPFLLTKKRKEFDRKTLLGGILGGLFIGGGYFFQTFGLLYTSATKSAFVTGLYVLTVPFFSYMILKRLPTKKNFYGLVIASAGTAFLFLEQNMSILFNIGDILTVFCALCFGIQVVILSKFIRKTNFIEFTIVQLSVVCLLSLFLSFNGHSSVMLNDVELWKALFVVGVLGTGFCFLGQSVSQNTLSADEAAVIYTSEPLFAGLAGLLFLKEILNVYQVFGAFLIITGILVSEVSLKRIFLNRR